MDRSSLTISEQQKIFDELFYGGEHIKTDYNVHDKWYVISRAWIEKWKMHIGRCQSESGTYFALSDEQPGKIDVSSITCNRELKPNLLINAEVVLIPECLMDKLIQWYDVVGGKETVPMRVVYMGSDQEPSLDLYPPKLTLTPKSNGFKKINIELNSKNTIGDIKRVIQKNNPNTVSEHVILYDAKNHDILSEDDTATLKECSLDGSVELQYEVKCGASGLANGDGSLKTFMCHNSTNLPVGACGLSNLGNTCFMNTAIQCISNVPPLRDYFLSKRYQSEINETNRLGSGGYVALSFAELICKMWDESSRGSSLVPRNLKVQIARIAPQFQGYQQHDAQELMNVLLDFLNEDLNKIKQKPYIEVKDGNGRPDDEIAEEAWSDYKKRNDSIIVDLFHGLLKSTVTCNECNYVSVTFDPFATLSLPLTTLEIDITVWPDAKHALHIPPSCRAVDILTSLKRVRTLQDGHDYFVTVVCDDCLRVIPHVSTENLRARNVLVFDLPKGSVAPVQVKVEGYAEPLHFLIGFGTHKPNFSPDDVVDKIKEQLAKLSFECDAELDDLNLDHILRFDVKELQINPDEPIIVNLPKPMTFKRTTKSKKHRVQLMDCLDLFLSTEQLSERDPWYCKVCKAHRQAFKKFDIWFLPRVLIIQLKRYRNIYRVHKNEAFVDYPENGLAVYSAKGRKYVYDLVAVSNHMGGLGGGHYTALAKNGDRWYNFDDSYVSLVQSNHVVTQSAYCLVYLLRDSEVTTNGTEDHK